MYLCDTKIKWAGIKIYFKQRFATSHRPVSHQAISHGAVSHRAVSHQAICRRAVSHQAISHRAVSHRAIFHVSRSRISPNCISPSRISQSRVSPSRISQSRISPSHISQSRLSPYSHLFAGLTWEEAKAQCPPGVVPACHNAEDSVTISGASDAMLQFMKELKAKDVFVREVNSSDIAYHSYFMDKIHGSLKDALTKVCSTVKNSIYLGSARFKQ